MSKKEKPSYGTDNNNLKKLNFGCGNDIREGWDNCDIQPQAPIKFDFNKFPYPLKNDYYDYVLIYTVLENLENPSKVFEELRKKCKKNAIVEIICPYWNNKGVWNDPFSKRGFNETFFRLIAERPPEYYIDHTPQFKIDSLKLIPTNVGKWLPKIIREKLSTFVSGMIMHIHVKLRVIK
jgi:SAM-dependent methyltransferase